MKTSTILNTIFKGFLFIFIMISGSCSEKEEIRPDTKPIQIQILPAGNVSASSATFNAEITYLNDEKVLDYGFIVSEKYDGEGKKISLGVNAKPGLIQFDYKPTKIFSLNQSLLYKFYLVTDKKEYNTEFISFSVKDFWVNQQDLIKVTLGDSLLLTGNFKQLDNSIKVVGYNNNNLKNVEILKRDDKNLLLKIPTDLGAHGQTISLYLTYTNDYSNRDLGLVNLSILGRVEFDADKPIYLGDGLSLRTYGLEYFSSGFNILIGNSMYSFYDNKVSLEDIQYTGEKLRLGYYNGHDTIFSEKKLALIEPKSSDLTLKQTNFHPGQPFELSSNLLYRFFGERMIQIKIADSVYTDYIFPKATSSVFYIPNFKQGKYDIEVLSRFYPAVKLQKALEVIPISAKIINTKPYYYNDVIEVSGNFVNGVNYYAMLNDYDIFSGTAKSGKLEIPLPVGKFGMQQLFIGADAGNREPAFAEALPIQIKGGLIESISPLSANAGDIITLKGKGFNVSIWIRIADLDCKIMSQTETEIKFLAPNSARKGKFPVNIEYIFSNDILQSSQLLELK